MKEILFKDLLVDTKDGDWGRGEPSSDTIEYSVVRGTDFHEVSLGIVSNVPIRYLVERTVGRRTLRPDDIVLETAGGSPQRPTGRTLLLSERVLKAFDRPVTCASFARFLRVDSCIADPAYVYWYLQNLYNTGVIEQYQVQHTGVARFQYTDFASSWRVALPDALRQRAIAEVLGALDDKIAANVGVAAIAAELAAMKFESALRHGTVDVSLGEATVTLARGITPTYTDDAHAMTVLNQKCIRGQRVDEAAARKTTVDRVRAEKVLQYGDVLVNSTGYGTLGRVARWTGPDEATVDSHITIVRFDRELVDQTCGGFALLRAQSDIEDMGEGSTGQTELSRSELAKFRVRLPIRESQPKLASELDGLIRLADTQIRENSTLAELRNTLLPHLMSGRLRVKDAEEQVEAVV